MNIAPSSEFPVAEAELGSPRTKGHHFRSLKQAPPAAKRLTLTQSGPHICICLELMMLQKMLFLTGPAHLSPAGIVTADPQRIC